jgi:kynureninase
VNDNDIETLDRNDPLASYRDRFVLPSDTIYLDGNSLGAMPQQVKTRIEHTLAMEWSQDLIQSWNKNAWIDLPSTVGEKIARLIGAAEGQVICADSTSVNLFKLLVTALNLKTGRKEILSQTDNFPTDLYMAQGAVELLTSRGVVVNTCPEDDLADAISDDTAVLMLTHTNFRTGKVHDMQLITRIAHKHGALVLWDLSHSAGAMPIDLDDCEVDMAVGCGYKYLNGGPGAPAFLYLSRKLQDQVTQPLTGWMGHIEPFGFNADYSPAKGILQYLCGTPPVLSMAALDAALDLYADVDLGEVRKKSVQLTELFISLVKQAELGLELVSPVDSGVRGSQVSFGHGQAYAIIQALIARGVIGDFRDPDIMRFGIAPLYTRYQDIKRAADMLAEVITGQTYLSSQFVERKPVT